MEPEKIMKLIFLTVLLNGAPHTYSSELEFSKDIGSFLIESTQESRCNGHILITTPECSHYLNFAIEALSYRDITVVVINYEVPFASLSSDIREKWKKFLRWRSESCNIVFICDLNRSEIPITNIGFLEYPKLIRGFDQVIYFSDFDFNFSQEYAWRVLDSEREVLRHSDALMSAKVVNKSIAAESLIQISSICHYCQSYGNTVNETSLGYWQRNRTLIAPFFEVFNNLPTHSFLHFDFKIGYSNYIPQLDCTKLPTQKCSGVEWEILNTLSTSLDLNFTLINYTKEEDGTNKKNASLLGDISDGVLDFGIGGLHVKREEISGLDYTQEFLQESIVFVIERRHNIYILGIFLPFQPHVWPVLILAFMAVSFLLVYIPRRQNVSMPISYGFQFSLSYLVGQPLTHYYITHKPRFLLKIILSVWWFACITIGVLYNTSLITSLINPVRLREPDSLGDLLKFDYKFMVTEGRRGGNVLALLYDIASAEREGNAIMKIKQRLVNSTLDSPDGFVAFVMEESAVQYTNWRKTYGFSNIKVIREKLFLRGYGWGVRATAPYKPKLESALSWLTATGLVENWWQNSASSNANQKEQTSSEIRLKNKLSQIQMNLEVLQGAFIFMLLGCAISVILFILEIWRSRYTFRFFTIQEIRDFYRKWIDSTDPNKVEILTVKPKSEEPKFVKENPNHKLQYLK